MSVWLNVCKEIQNKAHPPQPKVKMAVMLPPYPPFEEKEGPNLSTAWEDWLEGIESMLDAMGIEEKKDKFVKLWHYLGPVRKTLKKLEENGVQDKDYDKAKKALNKHFCPKRNNIYLLNKLYHTKQDDGESVDNFYMRVKEQMDAMNLEKKTVAEIVELMTLAQLVNCTSDATLRTKALRDSDMKLRTFLDTARSFEMANFQSSEISGKTSNIDALHHKSGKFQPKNNFRKKDSAKSSFSFQKKDDKEHDCRRCGTRHEAMKCPAYGQTCLKCKGKNHYAKMCSSKKAHAVENYDRDDDDSQFVFSVPVVMIESQEKDDTEINVINHAPEEEDWIVELDTQGKKLETKLDTGAQTNTISEYDLDRVSPKTTIYETSSRLKAYGGFTIPIKGKCTLPVIRKGKEYDVPFTVVKGKEQALLGKKYCQLLGYIELIQTVSQDKIVKKYPEVFNGLGCLPGEVKITIDETVPPVVNACRKVAFALVKPLKVELARMKKLEVIVEVDEPVDRVSALHLTPKKNKDIRVCLDPRDLNRAVKREHYKLPTREEIMANFAGAMIFSKLDASAGFWQLKLDEDSSKLTTFNTPFGRYRFLRLPFGISSAPEIYHKKIREIFEGIPNVDTSMDDIIVWGRTVEEHDKALTQVLEASKRNNLTLNKEKCQFGVKELVFLGDRLTTDGIKPDEAKISAITNMPRPICKEDVQRFLGMVTYLAKWIPEYSSVAAPLRQLLEKKNEWQWNPEQEKSWQELKSIISSEPVLQYFDPAKPIKISSDANKDGLGALLLQQHKVGVECVWKPVAYASRSMTSAETRYAQIEKELLSITFACERFHQFIYGARVIAETDHKPLISNFKKNLNDCPLRIQRMLLRLQRYDLDVQFIPGKELVAADALSRATERGHVSEIEEPLDLYVNMVLDFMPMTDRCLQLVREETNNDPALVMLRNTTLQGWPLNKTLCPTSIQEFWNVRDELSVAEGLLLKGSKIIIPSSMRKEILTQIHEGHLGIEKCQRRARDCVFWPGISVEIKDMVKSCQLCLIYSSQQAKEPLQPHELPTRPWQRVGSDLMSWKGKDYLIVSDYFSLFPIVSVLNKATSGTVISSLKDTFATHGIPDTLMTDNGPQYSSREFEEFAKDWKFEHITSSPHYPQSNGLAESSVKTVKRIIQKGDMYKGLLAYRSTPLGNGLSPAQMLMKRRLKTHLPILPSLLRTEGDEELSQKREMEKEKQKESFDRHTKTLPKLKPGETVRVYDHNKNIWSDSGVVIDQTADRSYQVRTDKGAVLRRNRRDIKSSYIPPQEHSQSATPVDPPLTPQPPAQVEPPKTPVAQPNSRPPARKTGPPRRLIEEM